MQLSEIKTVEQAKALAYDQVLLIEQSQANLRVLQQRIAEINDLHTPAPDESKANG